MNQEWEEGRRALLTHFATAPHGPWQVLWSRAVECCQRRVGEATAAGNCLVILRHNDQQSAAAVAAVVHSNQWNVAAEAQ